MAGAKAKDLKSSPKVAECAQPQRESHFIEFMDIRCGYLPGERMLLTYRPTDKTYAMHAQDYIALYKCCSKYTGVPNKYRWPVSTISYGKLFRIKLGLPNPDRRLKMSEYQFVYVSYEQNRVVGRSQSFKISDIVELDSDFEHELNVANVVDRELFELKVTNPLPVKIYDVNQRTVEIASVQEDSKCELSKELKEALNSDVSSQNTKHVSELVKRFDQPFSVPPSVSEHLPRPMKTLRASRAASSNPSSSMQTQVDEILQQVETNNNRETELVKVQSADVTDAELTFLKRFVLPYISGVLEQLSTDGYSKIICSNNQIVLLNSDDGDTLNLSQGWGEYKTSQAISKTSVDERVTINLLSERLKELAQELELLKLVSNRRHAQYAKELTRVEKEIREQADCKLANEFSDDLKKTNRVLLAHIEDLEQKLAQKTEEYEILSQLFASQACCLQHNDSLELLRKQTMNWRSKRMAQRRMATNTDVVQTKDEAANTGFSQKSKKVGTFTRPPVVQKATSYAAAPTHDPPSAQAEKKQTTTSDRSLPASLTNDQQSFLKLLQKFLSSEQTTEQPEATPTPDSAESSDSLGEAMRRLFEIYSTPSLASTTTSRRSVKSDESILEAIKALFTSESSTHDLVKKHSYPPTPSNSADNLTREKLSEDVKHSTSMRKVLEKLLIVGEEQTASKPTCKSKSSLWSLGEAMIKAFQEDLSDSEIQNKANFSTSNESLSQAMHWLFDTLSQQNLLQESSSDTSRNAELDSSTSSLGSMLLWGLTEPTPEEYKNIDVKAVNKAKQNKRKSNPSSVDCECQGQKEMKNPSFSSVSRISSPDRDVNIAFPSLNKTVFTPKTSSQKSSQDQPSTSSTPFTFKTNTDLSSLVSDVSKLPTNETSLEEHIKQAAKKITRPSRSSRKRTSAKCPHCGIVIQSRSVGQTEYRMNRHIRLHHKKHDDSWAM